MYAEIGGWIGAGFWGGKIMRSGAAAGFVTEGFAGPDLGEGWGGAANPLDQDLGFWALNYRKCNNDVAYLKNLKIFQ